MAAEGHSDRTAADVEVKMEFGDTPSLLHAACKFVSDKICLPAYFCHWKCYSGYSRSMKKSLVNKNYLEESLLCQIESSNTLILEMNFPDNDLKGLDDM